MTARIFSPQKLWLCGSALSVLVLALPGISHAQVTVSDGRTTQIRTSTAGGTDTPDDVVIGTGGSVTVTDTGPAVVVDSDNTVTNSGSITIENVDDAVGVLLEGGADRGYTQTGSINITEDYTPANTDDDPFIDEGVASGSGRTGILISGASPFEGDVTLEAGSTITVEGNDSFGINLDNTPMMMGGLTGNLRTSGGIAVGGDRSVGVNVASNVIGNLENQGTITVQGTDSTAYQISADVQGGFVNSGAITTSGQRFNQRVPFNGSDRDRDDLGLEDLGNSGPSLSVSGNISNGIYLQRRLTDRVDADGNPVLDDDGNVIQDVASTSNITHFGSAPAILIDGNGTPISIGVVAPITDPNDPDFDAALQYGFVNQGAVTSNGLADDFDATVFSLSDATLVDGINNAGSMTSISYVGAVQPDITSGTGLSRVIVLGSNGIAEQINNTGLMLATANEAVDQAFFDQNNILAPRALQAIAIDIEASATAGTITNAGSISSVITGRLGTAIAIRDTSGTLRTVNNTGLISATGVSTDPDPTASGDFTTIAIDARNNTLGFSYTQSQAADLEDGTTPIAPVLVGDVFFGSGNDSFVSTAGSIAGDVNFGAGDDTLSLSGTTFLGTVRNSGGLTLTLADESTMIFRDAEALALTSASIDGTSAFRPVLDGATGEASTLMASGDITFESGASISPLLTNFVGAQTQSYTIADAGGALTIGDLAALSTGAQPFLYETGFQQVGDTLVLTLDLRDPAMSVEQGGLGLDAAQIQAFQPALQALSANSELGNGFAVITEAQDFYNAYNQILPEFAAAARQFVVTGVDGATGAVGSHLDNARRSPDKPGGAWIQEFAYFADRELAGLSQQYRGQGFGFTGGLDTAWGPFHAVGVNVGFSSTDVEDVVGIDEPLEVLTFQAGGYAGWQSGNLGIEAYAGGGYNEFSQNRRVRVNSFFGTAGGDWTGTHINGSIRAGYDVELNEKYWIRPAVSVDYLRLSEKGYRETGDTGVALVVEDRLSELGSASAMINLGAKFEGKRTWIRPSMRVGYRYDFMNDPVVTNFRYSNLSDSNGNLFDSELATLNSVLYPDQGLLVGFSIAAGSQYSSIGFDFDSDIRDGFIRHTGRIVIRLLF